MKTYQEIFDELSLGHPSLFQMKNGIEEELSPSDRIALLHTWAQETYNAQLPPIPLSVTMYQLGQWLTEAQHSDITKALAAMPASTPEEQNAKFKARMAWLKATTIERTHPLVPVLASAIGLSTSAEIDVAFIEISQIT